MEFCFFSTSTLFKIVDVKIYKVVMWPVVSYGCKTWSLTFRNVNSVRDQVLR
jgi:hypothetical protein